MNPLTIPPNWVCTRRVGFLFPHPCTRKTPAGCPDCKNGQIEDPYRQRTDRRYSNYDRYSDDDWGTPIQDSAFAFTAADGGNLIKPRHTFEDDMSAS